MNQRNKHMCVFSLDHEQQKDLGFTWTSSPPPSHPLDSLKYTNLPVKIIMCMCNILNISAVFQQAQLSIYQLLRFLPRFYVNSFSTWNTLMSAQLIRCSMVWNILHSFFCLISLVFPFRTFYLCAKTGVEADEWIKILRWKLVSYSCL